MEFTSMNQDQLDALFHAFEQCLAEHNITFTFMRMTEEEGVISFDFCNNPEKARSVEFEGNNLIGLDTEYIASEILVPILPRIKAYATLK
ncbi:hypothetical protein [Bacillus sp. JJ722]|uniref:hypothetical protein n=1 Tax=Bacillus sp. JJ722 TaxID=3122973 RepID=UPI002FFEA897